MFLLSLPFGMLATFLPLYGCALGATGVEVGALFTAFAIVGVVGRPIAGIVTDKVGRKPLILAGATLYLAATVLFALSFTLPVLYIARIVQGIASTLFWGATYALMADLGDQRSGGRLFGRLLESFNAGTIVGTLLGYAAIVGVGIVVGWRASFALFVLGNLAALVLFVRNVPNTHAVTAETSHLATPRNALLFLLFISFLVEASYALTTPITLLYLRDRFHASYFWIGVAYAPAAITLSVLPSYMGRLGDRWNRKAVLAVAVLLSGVFTILFPLSPNLFFLAVAWFLQAVLASAVIPTQSALVSQLTGGNVRGGAYGFYTGATGLGDSVGPLAGGWLYDTWGHNSPFWATVIVLPIAAGLIAWKLPSANK